jgi:hypothetical protein
MILELFARTRPGHGSAFRERGHRSAVGQFHALRLDPAGQSATLILRLSPRPLQAPLTA